MEENKYILPVAIIIAGALIGWGFYANSNKNQEANNEATQKVSENLKQENLEIDFEEEDHILGKPTAKIKIITFSDLECPYCSLFHQTMSKIIDEYGKDGKVAWTMRHFPVHGESAEIKAVATECAALSKDEKTFWAMVKKIFEKEEDGSWIKAEKVYEIASALEIDTETFKACMENPEITNKIKNSYQEALDLKAQGTPFSVVILPDRKNFPIEGAQPYDSIKNMIEMILSEI